MHLIFALLYELGQHDQEKGDHDSGAVFSNEREGQPGPSYAGPVLASEHSRYMRNREQNKPLASGCTTPLSLVLYGVNASNSRGKFCLPHTRKPFPAGSWGLF